MEYAVATAEYGLRVRIFYSGVCSLVKSSLLAGPVVLSLSLI